MQNAKFQVCSGCSPGYQSDSQKRRKEDFEEVLQMMKQDEMQTLAGVVDSMHKLAEGLETLAVYLLRDAGQQQVSEVPKEASPMPQAEEADPEPVQPTITLEEVRAVLAEKSAAGHTDEVRKLLQDFGAAKLSAVDPKDYAALKAKAEVL